ncbi:MAG: glycosyltransferase family 1 protein [Planctomycetota bacterium]|jgi:glycosyltransferase involved in cell wall biosynthesis|nr:glycosyltransferase family 1 protein [Planctomycetota bacterium]MDP6941977.1 glycosyltransferase family 1 protein [Planctomycetota bacterium]
MKLFFDASALALRGYTKAGIYRYGIELLRHLPDALPDDWELNLHFHFFRQKHAARMREVLQETGNLPYKTSRTHPWITSKLGTNLESLVGPHDLVHGPFDRVPKSKSSARVVTIHDLAFLRAAAGLPTSWVAELTKTVPPSARRATRVITASEFSKSDIVEWLHIPAEKVSVVPHGLSPEFRPPADPLVDLRRLEERYKIRPGFILYLGTLQPNKNIEGLCAAYHDLRQDGFEGQLVLAGKEGWLFDEMWERITENGHDEGVLRTGYIEEEDIPRLYGNCSCFSLVSILEGFGIPTLEAMACGAPVVVADSCSLPEVAGGAAVIVDPYDSRSIAEGIEKAATRGEFRDLLIKKGLERASQFSWQKSAEAHASVYRQAMQEVGRL